MLEHLEVPVQLALTVAYENFILFLRDNRLDVAFPICTQKIFDKGSF